MSLRYHGVSLKYHLGLTRYHRSSIRPYPTYHDIMILSVSFLADRLRVNGIEFGGWDKAGLNPYPTTPTHIGGGSSDI